MRRRRLWWAGLYVIFLATCGSGSNPQVDGTLTVYSTVTQETVDAVIEVYRADNPGVTVELFRAPTGEMTARIASELRTGDLQADVLWLSDPLSIQQYASDGLLASWTPAELDAVPEVYRTDTFFGTRLLNLVIVQQPGLGLTDWPDLRTVEGTVALPDPGFAGSAFGALGFFAQAEGYGLDFYQELVSGGAVQVQAPDDVIVGVAEGLYATGITLDNAARQAMADGSPLEMVWPSSGAIAVYSPIAVVADSASVEAAEAFVDVTLGIDGQEAIAATGWQPIRGDVGWESEGPALTFDWATAFDTQQELLDDYRAIVGG